MNNIVITPLEGFLLFFHTAFKLMMDFVVQYCKYIIKYSIMYFYTSITYLPYYYKC